MSVPTDKEIKRAASAALKAGDLSTMTLKTIRCQLEEQFGCSLVERKEIIRKSLDKFLAKNADMAEYNAHIESEVNAELPASESHEDFEYVEPSKKKRGEFVVTIHFRI